MYVYGYRSTLSFHLLHDCRNREVWVGGNSYDHSNDDSIEIDNNYHTQDNDKDEESDYNYDKGTNLSIQMLSDDSEGTDNNTRITKFSDVENGHKKDEKESMSIAERSERMRSVRSNDDDSAFSHSKLMNIVYKNKNKMYNLHLDSDNDTLSTNTTTFDDASLLNRNMTRNNFNSSNEVLIKSKKNLSNDGNSDNSNNFHGQKTTFKNSLTVANRRSVFDKFLLCGECITVYTNRYIYIRVFIYILVYVFI
jgi:hypothetical protein